ncbi:DUF4105 domain-containing protein [Bacteriovoracaceae bacterium]|nr:DUF4105 domain-containing protein [Bacteriovoracaceae bacterium]
MQKAQKLKLHKHPTWLQLLRYQKELSGGYQSQIDGPNFFLSKEGKENPKNELIKNLSYFLNGTKDKKNVLYVCYYPNRYEFLKNQLNFDSDINYERDCPLLYEFLNKLNAQRVSLVFSSYFVSRPASAFGHTFLRFHKSKNQEADDILDYIVNFSGTIDTKNPIMYGLKGLLGGFQGVFTVMPYYYKIREYNDFESRDLWQYELNYDSSDIEIMVKNIWEMRRTYFDYYYLDENCSYQLLTLLDLVGTYPGKVKTRFAADQKYFFVAPIDTVKSVLKEESILKSVKFRPAKKTQMELSRDLLNKNEIKLYKGFVKDYDISLLENLSVEKKVKVLDAAIDYFDFQHAEKLLLEDEKTLMKKNKVLLARAKTKIKFKKNEIKLDLSQAPHQSHESSSVSFAAGGVNTKSQFTQLTLSPAYHSLLDPSQGMPRNTTMEMMKFTLRYEKLNPESNSSLHLEKLSLVNAHVLQDITEFDREISYGFDVGQQRIYSSSFYGRNAIFVQGHSGLAFSSSNSNTFYGTVELSLFKVDKDLRDDGLIFQYGPKIGYISRPSQQLSLFYDIAYLRNLDEFQKFSLQHKFNFRYHWQSFDMDFSYLYQEGRKGEYILGLVSFF